MCFFIDDHQGINKEEIGSSYVIRDAAENYSKRIKDETADFIVELEDNRKKYSKTEKDIVALSDKQAILTIEEYTHRYDRLKKRLQKYQELLAKEYQLSDIKTNVSEVEIQTIELVSQFRCNGSDNYLDWLDIVLYEDMNQVKARGISFQDEYKFEVCGSIYELEKRIRALNEPDDNQKQIARIAAGYCWKWSTKLQPDGDLYKDVKIGDWEMPWETNNVKARPPFISQYAPSADLWASHPMGINQVGCIFSAQGFEVDYIGVILGPDIRYDKEKECVVAVKGHTHSVSDSDPYFDEHIKNIYRALMLRGKKGCLIYCVDPDLGEYFKKLAFGV